MSSLQKQILLGFVVLLLGVFSWWFLKYVFYVGNLTLTCWIGGIVLFIFWGVALCLAMLLINDKRILYGSFLLTLVAFAMFFNNEAFYYLIGLIILFLVFLFASRKIGQEKNVQVNLNFWRIWKRGLPILVTVLILIISLVYYFSPSLERAVEKEIRLPRNVFDVVIGALTPLIEKRLPGGIDSLDVEAGKILGYEEIKELEEKYGIEIKQGETAKDFLYKLVNFQLNSGQTPYKKFIPIGLAVALFLGLRLISIVYIALVIILSWMFLKLLILLKFARTEIETKEVETIKL
jgi:hypothetical protein